MFTWDLARVIILLTSRCNFECAHCVRECSPREDKGSDMTPDEVTRILADFNARGGRVVCFSGGEPTLNLPALMAGLKLCRDRGMEATVTTNAWWGALHLDYLGLFRVFGLKRITVSYDAFHASFSSWRAVQNVLFESARYGIQAQLNWTSRNWGENLKAEIRGLLGPVLSDLAMEKIQQPAMVFAVGRARQMASVWKRDAFPWICPELKMIAPMVSLAAGGHLWHRCACCNPTLGFDYSGDFTTFVDDLEESPMYQELTQYGLIPLMRKRKALDYVDACQFCVSELKYLWRHDDDQETQDRILIPASAAARTC